MNWQDILKTVAPTVLSATLGPMGNVAYSAIASILGVPQDKVESAIAKGMMTPEQVSQIKALELKYQAEESERGFKYAELEFRDKDSARNMQIATHSKMPAVLTIMVTVGFFGILGLLFFHPELKGNEIVMIMVGQLSAVWAGCIAFYTGTTYGSANKNQMLAQSKPA